MTDSTQYRHLVASVKSQDFLAGKAIDIETRKRKSRRVRAANKFLSNISLDGKVPTHKDKKDSEKRKGKQPMSLDKEEIQLISKQSFLDPCLQARPKFLSSFSTTDAVEENKDVNTAGSVSSTSTFHFNHSQTHSCYNRATSLRDSKHMQNNIVCVLERNLVKHHGQLCGKRIMLLSGHRVPFAIFSTLRYTQQDKCSDSLDKAAYKLQRASGENQHDSCGIKGIDIGSEDKPVSYGHLLIPTCAPTSSRNILSPRKNTIISSSPTPEESRRLSFSAARGSNTPSKMHSPREYYCASNYADWKNYDPYLLDDPELRSGRHRKVLRLSSFMVSIIEYVKPSQLKKDLNEQFKEKFPNLEITLSKLRSLKHDLAKLSSECCLDYSTVAYSTVYFEKLVWWGKISKANRKLVVGSCLLLAAKFNSDLKKDAVKHLIDHISDWFRVSAKDLLLFEIQALIAMEFNLHVPIDHVMPHLKRLEFGNMAFM